MEIKKIYHVDIPSTVDFKETSQLCGDVGDQPNQPTRGAHIFVNSKMEFQTMQGVGGAFSELGGKALLSLDDNGQNEVAQDLFKDKFSYFRLPIGSSDFGLDAYSLDDVDGDYEMEHFSLARDEQYLIPFMKFAKKYCDDMKIHASPWSPPAWMKVGKDFGHGASLVDDPAIYTAYAKYFVKYIEEYKKQGFPIHRLNIQNEPDVNPAYPSSNMPPKLMTNLIKNYIHPTFKANNVDTEIFAGTFRSINGASACDFLTYDEEITDYIDGIGCQYTVMQQIYNIFNKYPNLKIMHTESNCFRGENSWEQAITLFINVVNYINAGCDVFTYWNMILNTIGESSWGWKQNSLVTIDEDAKTFKYNPDYYIMTLVSACIKPNAKKIVYTSMNKVGLAFKNEDGSINVMISNFSDKEEVGSIDIDGVKLDLTLAPMSIATYTITM